jgi:hypothetical protein
MDWELAQVNVAHALAPLDSPELTGFMDLLEPLDALARRSPGFVWRPHAAELDPGDLVVFGDLAWTVVNLSVWASVEALRDFTFAGAHGVAVRRRRDWFAPPTGPAGALWWVPAGHRPPFAEAHGRLEQLRRHGPGPDAFTLGRPYPPPTGPDRGAVDRLPA